MHFKALSARSPAGYKPINTPLSCLGLFGTEQPILLHAPIVALASHNIVIFQLIIENFVRNNENHLIFLLLAKSITKAKEKIILIDKGKIWY